jgi:alcohol dehydrogenase class IV
LGGRRSSVAVAAAGRRLLTGEPASVEAGARFVEELGRELRIPRLSEHGLREADLEAVIARARVSSSMQGNPIELADEELIEILSRAL